MIMEKKTGESEHSLKAEIEEVIHKIDEKYLGKWAMKQPYSKTKLLSIRARGCIDLFRPFTLAAPFFVSLFIIMAGLIYTKGGLPGFWWVKAILASFTIVLVNAASNSLNQATDVESDKISKPHRPIVQGVLDVKDAQSLAYILYLSSVVLGMIINAYFGFLVFLIILFTITYSLPPRMKKYLFINQIWISIPRGFLGILASWSVFGDPFTKTPIIIGAIATVFLIGGTATKDILDSMADKMTGVRTLVNTVGVKKAALISLPFMVIPFAFIPFFIFEGALKPYLWPLTFSMIFSFIIYYLMIRGTENKILENVHAWSVMYIEYIFFSLGFAILTIFGGAAG